MSDELWPEEVVVKNEPPAAEEKPKAEKKLYVPHRCHAPYCFNLVRVERLLCTFHWDKVPTALSSPWWNSDNVKRGKCIHDSPCAEAAQVIYHLQRLAAQERKDAEYVELPEIQRVVADTGPDGPAVGVHYWIGGKYGFVPPPPFEGKGRCWCCGASPISTFPPFCAACAKDHYGDRIFTPSALAQRGIQMHRRRATSSVASSQRRP